MQTYGGKFQMAKPAAGDPAPATALLFETPQERISSTAMA